MSRQVDINCDLGEGFGNHSFGFDEQMLKFVSSANIACGFHAGDPLIMESTVAGCLSNGVAIGAHPGLPDLLGFGRRIIGVTPRDMHAYWTYQLGALGAFVKQQGGLLRHAKPHGAMYQLMANDAALAEAALAAMRSFDHDLRLYFPAPLVPAVAGATEKLGVETVQEVYVDLSYDDSGRILVERNKRLVSIDLVRERVRLFLAQRQIRTSSGGVIDVEARSLCVHSDTPNAVEILEAVLEVFAEESVEVSTP
jgi:UPF0271 protein